MTKEIKDMTKYAEKYMDKFIQLYGPKNGSYDVTYPYVRHGTYAEIPFEVIETKYNYKIKMDNRTRFFSNAVLAGEWVRDKGITMSRRGYNIH